MRKVTLVLALAALAAADTVDVSRHGRRVQVDGFLVEWGGGSAREWGSAWRWDAAVTPDGVAGYIASRGAPECGGWVFGISAGSGAAAEIGAPEGRPSDKNAAFDRDVFEREGAYNIEWLVPRGAVESGGASMYSAVIAVTGASGCGDTLPPVIFRVVREARTQKSAPAAVISMAGAAVLTIIIIVSRRKRAKRRYPNQKP